MKHKISRLKAIQFINILIICLLFNIFFSINNFSRANDDDKNIYKHLNMFGEVYERVRRDYVEEVTDKELIEAAIQGMLQSLDPHSSFLDTENFSDMQVQTKGKFG